MASNRIEFSSNGTGKAPKPVKASKPRPTKAEVEAATRARRLKGTLAKVLGGGCVAGLALSGFDSAIAVHELFGVHPLQAAAVAIIVDGLLLGAKLTVLVSKGEPSTTRWALGSIALCGLLSIFLNAAEFASHASTTAGMVGHAIFGGIIPIIVLVSSSYVGHLWLDSQAK